MTAYLIVSRRNRIPDLIGLTTAWYLSMAITVTVKIDEKIAVQGTLNDMNTLQRISANTPFLSLMKDCSIQKCAKTKVIMSEIARFTSR